MAATTTTTTTGRGIDALLTSRGKALAVGQEIRFTLIKAGSTCGKDPLHPAAPSETFPVVAKFAESVVKPDFRKFKRFYQQDIPSQKDDSDEEAAPQDSLNKPRKKRRYRRNEGPKRQWVLQEEEDYLETMISQQEQGKAYKQDSKTQSSRYEGLPEHNPSQYALISASSDGNLQVTLLPTPYGVQNFSQPAKIQTLSMTQAETAMEDQRSQMTRYMMHGRPGGNPGQKPPSSSKARLLGKLKMAKADDDGDEDGDDVMADVKFASRKGASAARKELLSTLGQGVAVDADGVMGGQNDAQFGGRRQRFHKVNIQQAAAANTARKASATNDGMAMADDFYQRDVKAEYEELDYDAHEQFDDDDVDVGETDQQQGMEMGENDLNNDDDDDDDEEEDDDVDEEKKAGLATVKGLRDMLAKARGEGVSSETKAASSSGEEDPPTPEKDGGDEKGLAQVLAAAKRKSDQAIAGGPANKAVGAVAVHVDASGQRILTLEGVRYEIFLHNKSIAMKALMKLYNIKKKSAKDRIKKFQAIIKELCNMHKDPVQGNMLVLKQHYAKGI